MIETVLDALGAQFPQAKKTTLRRMLEGGRVRLNGTVVKRAKEPMPAGGKLVVNDAPKAVATAVTAPLHPLKLIYEDDDVLVIDKPAGLLTSTVAREKRPTAIGLIRQYLERTSPAARAGVVHRLDRDASGLLVFAKNQMALRALKSQFFKHTVRREYLAITHGSPTPPSGRIDNRLVEYLDGTVHETERIDKGQRAITDYATLARGKAMAAVRVTLLTGRKHQIRAHLSLRGVPIVGDRVYGKPKDDAPRMMLAAVILGFDHPGTGKPMVFEQPIPKQFPLMGGQRVVEGDANTARG